MSAANDWMTAHHWPVESDWTTRLKASFEAPYFAELMKFVEQERAANTVYPQPTDVFNAFRLTSFANTKVVILGQDPYHGAGQAHGLSFSVQANTKIPPSLKNIYKELVEDLNIPIATTGDLTSWAEQGVLLLNTVLTVRDGEANSHRKQGWEKFTDDVIVALGEQAESKIVFLLWGKPAEKKTKLIADKHTIIISPHPSPLSAHRGFFGSRPFSRINQTLAESGRTSIRWESVFESSSV